MNRRMAFGGVGVIVMALAVQAFAQSSAPKVQISDAWVRLPAEGVRTTTAYFDVVNLTNTNDTLLSASSPWADRVVIQHYVTVGYDRKAKTVATLKVGAGKKVKLSASDYHLKLEGLTQPLRADQKIPMTLMFANAGRVEIEAAISKQTLGNMD